MTSAITKSLIFILLSLFLLSGCMGSECPPCDQHSEQVLTLLHQGQTQEAFEHLFEGATVENNHVVINTFQRQSNELLRRYKGITGFEKVDQRLDGKLYTSAYLLYQEAGLTRWAFYYYKTPDGQFRLSNLDATGSTASFWSY